MGEAVKEIALSYVRAFAISNQFFTGGDILEAFRKSNLPGSDLDWRNKWGAIISAGARKGWYIKAGRMVPTSKQSHTGSLVQWQSRLFTGEEALSGVTARETIEDLRKKVVLREIDIRAALWAAYEYGVECK